jgi:hypothetical protein
MASRGVSPGAALLRASRMFSIPAPLSRTGQDLASTVTFGSDTATSPHPTHLTITTPPSSLSRGDWGLKRPLPLRATTKSSTPLIRVDKIDTWEHITEFASAADHTLTLQKFQELNMPLSTPLLPDTTATVNVHSRTRRPTRSVFDSDLDSTTNATVGSEDRRWKFNGPWVAGQTEGEFNEYLSKEVRRRKPEFRKYLREQKASANTRKARAIAADKGEAPPPDVKAADITEEEMQQYLRELRQERFGLFRHIRTFLDLPPTPAAKIHGLENVFQESFGADYFPKTKLQKMVDNKDYQPVSNSPYAETGPPKTHPSAGLSYLRTSSFTHNHPVYGPQANPPPVQGRVIQPKASAVGAFGAKLGVAGIVTNVPTGHDMSFKTSSSRRNNGRIETIPGILMIEPEKVGGSKAYLEPRHATIDPKGLISLSVDLAQPAAVAVYEGLAPTPPPVTRRGSTAPTGIPTLTSSPGYGLTSDEFENRARVTENTSWGNVSSKYLRSEGTDKEALDSLKMLLAQSEAKENNE